MYVCYAFISVLNLYVAHAYIYMHPEQVWIYDESRLYSKSLSITASDILLNYSPYVIWQMKLRQNNVIQNK